MSVKTYLQRIVFWPLRLRIQVAKHFWVVAQAWLAITIGLWISSYVMCSMSYAYITGNRVFMFRSQSGRVLLGKFDALRMGASVRGVEFVSDNEYICLNGTVIRDLSSRVLTTVDGQSRVEVVDIPGYISRQWPMFRVETVERGENPGGPVSRFIRIEVPYWGLALPPSLITGWLMLKTWRKLRTQQTGFPVEISGR